MARALSGIGTVFSAAHLDAKGKLHGHDYEVVVWFEAGADATWLEGEIAWIRDEFDHSTLPAEMSRAEAVAETILGRMPDAVAVDISRPTLRLHARVER